MITKSEIQLVRSLADKRARTETGLFLAEGEKLIRELRASDFRVERIYALDGLFSGPEVTPVSPKEMERLSHLKTPGSSLALVRMPHRDLRSADPAAGLVLALDDVQNPGNMGTIIRLADWFGIGDIVCSEATADCFNPKVVQATMGAILRVRVHYTDLGRYLAAHAAAGIPVYGTFLDGEDLYNIGGPATAAGITRRLYIPPFPADRAGSESLNVAMAAGVVCAEFRRRMR